VKDKKSEAAGAPEMQPDSPNPVSESAEPITGKVPALESSPSRTTSGQSGAGEAKSAAEESARNDDTDQSLGTFLIAAREGRGLTPEDVVRETRLPSHYLRMMESNDYSKISDRLYLLPFLRRYATFLDLDQDDVAMRFVREVQRADATPPARLDQPLLAEPRKRRGWTGALVVIGLLVVVVGIYLYESERRRQVGSDTLAPHASASTATGAAAVSPPVAPQPDASSPQAPVANPAGSANRNAP
jgi:cytoskeletal protein RodZ